MAGQGMDRREILRVLAMASAASRFPGFHRWAIACGHSGSNHKLVSLTSSYQPQFFSPSEYATLEVLTELIIPSDDTPGAREAGVAEFIDFMVANDSEIQYRFRYGLAWMDAHARWLYDHPFKELTPQQQAELLSHLVYKNRHRPGEEDGRTFFERLREYTVMGFYTSRMGLEQLDYPGLKLMYDEMPGCPHPDDPEHRHLSPPQV